MSLDHAVDRLMEENNVQAKRIVGFEERINYAIDGIDALSPNWPEQVKKDVSAIKETLEQALKGK